MRRIVLAAVAAAAVLIPLSGTSAAAAAPSQATLLQQRIDYQLALLPGGRQIAPNQISWDKQGVIMTFAVPGMSTFGAGSCAYYHACLYGDVDYNDGPDTTPWQLSFYYCTARDLGDWGVRNQTSSWVNNQTANTWAAAHQYRDESHPEYGWVQLWGAGAYYADPWVGSVANDRADVFDPC